MGHSYFTRAMATADGSKDLRVMKVIELKCDAVAMLSLQLLGDDSQALIRTLRVG